MQLYYFQYVLDSPNLVSIVSTLNFIVLIPGLILTTFLSKKFGKKMTAIIGVTAFFVFEFLNFVVFGGNLKSFLVVNTLSNMSLVIPTTVCWAFIADVVEYQQWKTGIRSEGIIYSSYSFTRKITQALAGLISGSALTLVGYQPNVQQTASTIFGMKFIFFAVPGIATLIGMVIFLIFYPLTDKRHNQIVKELALREEI